MSPQPIINILDHVSNSNRHWLNHHNPLCSDSLAVIRKIKTHGEFVEDILTLDLQGICALPKMKVVLQGLC